MLANRDNPYWYFSDDQFLKEEDSRKMVDDYYKRCKEALHSDILEFNERMYGIRPPAYEEPEEKEQRKRKVIASAIISSVVFICLAVSLIMRQFVIFGYIGGSLFAFAGISIMITGKATELDSASKALRNRVMGLGIASGAILIALLIFFRDRFSSSVFFILLFIVSFGIAGLTMLLSSVVRAFAGKLIYTQDVEAACVGFVRTMMSEQSDSSSRGNTYICTSPLFNYSYEGNQYTAVYDDFVIGRDSTIALDQKVTIRIDPKHPENIKSPEENKPAGIAFLIILGLAFTAVAIGLGIYVAGGNANNLTFETRGSTGIPPIDAETVSTSSLPKIVISDKAIEEYYLNKMHPGEEWYCEISTVASVEETENGMVITLSDSTFKTFRTESAPPEPGTEVICFYVIDKDRLELEYGYKTIMSYGDVRVFEYSGSHTAYAGK